jgi:hypothetical protein
VRLDSLWAAVAQLTKGDPLTRNVHAVIVRGKRPQSLLCFAAGGRGREHGDEGYTQQLMSVVL